ncbi:MAG: DUF4440 domain-containing protein [Gemmatimonadales bacterium]|nr:DUF4440 domain-containing protein [Gemmatimonadales bacterium]
MRTHTLVGVLVLCATALSAQGEGASAPKAAFPSVTLPPELERVLRDYETAWQERDSATLAQLFAEDGFVLPSDRLPVRGRSAIEKRYAQAGGALALRALAFATADSVGYIIGAYAWERDGADAGKFVLALKRGPTGRWLIAADIDNQNN